MHAVRVTVVFDVAILTKRLYHTSFSRFSQRDHVANMEAFIQSQNFPQLITLDRRKDASTKASSVARSKMVCMAMPASTSENLLTVSSPRTTT